MTEDEIVQLAESMGISMRPGPRMYRIDEDRIGFKRPEGLHCAGQRTLSFAKEIWRAAWNEAVKQAVSRVREKYDVQEPWIEPEDIEELYLNGN